MKQLSAEQKKIKSERAKAYNKAHKDKARRAQHKSDAKRFFMMEATPAELVEFRYIIDEALKLRQAESEQ